MGQRNIARKGVTTIVVDATVYSEVHSTDPGQHIQVKFGLGVVAPGGLQVGRAVPR